MLWSNVLLHSQLPFHDTPPMMLPHSPLHNPLQAKLVHSLDRCQEELAMLLQQIRKSISHRCKTRKSCKRFWAEWYFRREWIMSQWLCWFCCAMWRILCIFRTRPMCVSQSVNIVTFSWMHGSWRVIMNASALPDPREVSYDLLLSWVTVSKNASISYLHVPRRILSYLELYGTSSWIFATIHQTKCCVLCARSRSRLHSRILCRWRQEYSRLELGMESLQESQSEVPQESEEAGRCAWTSALERFSLVDLWPLPSSSLSTHLSSLKVSLSSGGYATCINLTMP